MSNKTFIRRVVNQSSKSAWLLHRLPTAAVSYDVVLAPGETADFAALYAPSGPPTSHSALVPDAGSADQFKIQHVRVQAGAKTWALYHRDDAVRATSGDWSDKAEPIAGAANAASINLVITDDKVSATRHPVILKPYLASVSWFRNRYAYYGLGPHGELYEKNCIDGAWKSWNSLGAPVAGLAGPVAAVSWIAGRLSVFALGLDGALYARSWWTTRWEDWSQHAAPTSVKLVDLAATSWATERYGVYAVGDNGRLYERWWKTDHWQGWNDLDKPGNVNLTGPVTAVSYSEGRYAVYALGNDGAVWEKWATSSWSNWASIGRPDKVQLLSLTSVSWANRIYQVMGVDTDGQLWSKLYSHGWGNWEKIGRPDATPLDKAVTAIWFKSEDRTIFARGRDGEIYQKRYNPEGPWELADGS